MVKEGKNVTVCFEAYLVYDTYADTYLSGIIHHYPITPWRFLDLLHSTAEPDGGDGR